MMFESPTTRTFGGKNVIFCLLERSQTGSALLLPILGSLLITEAVSSLRAVRRLVPDLSGL